MAGVGMDINRFYPEHYILFVHKNEKIMSIHLEIGECLKDTIIRGYWVLGVIVLTRIAPLLFNYLLETDKSKIKNEVEKSLLKEAKEKVESKLHDKQKKEEVLKYLIGMDDEKKSEYLKEIHDLYSNSNIIPELNSNNQKESENV